MLDTVLCLSYLMIKPNYYDKTIHIHKNDRVFLFTDGISELRNESKLQFGEDKILEILRNNYKTNPENVLNMIVDEINLFSKNICDDITMSLIEII